MGEARRRGWIAVLAALLVAAPAPAVVFGDVEVAFVSEPKGISTHGYVEVWVHVLNRSKESPREVRLTLPHGDGYRYKDPLGAVTRTVVVEPGQTARVSLAYPERLSQGVYSLTVAIDGRGMDDPVPITISSRGIYPSPHVASSSSGPKLGLVLYSKTVDTRFPDWMAQAHFQRTIGSVALPGGAMPPLGGAAGGGYVRADLPAEGWSPNWLGYTRYDGIVVTAADLRAMPVEVRAAVVQYVECGGTLVVLGRDAPLPGPWKPATDGGSDRFRAGFGECLVSDREDLSGPDLGPRSEMMAAWARTLTPWERYPSTSDTNRAFPVIQNVAVPTTALLVLMFGFVLVIGPINLYLLGRLKRRLWLFWTVPLISAVTCLTVLGYMALTEGWGGRTRIEGFTILDENTRRASTLGWSAFYTPLLPGDGLHFSPETEVTYLNGENPTAPYYSRPQRTASALSIDWTGEQHFVSGWLTPRVPAHFAVRKGEARRERVTITTGPDGRPEAVNGLGADLTDLWYRDEQNRLFHAQNVPAGGRAELEPAPSPAQQGTPSFRDIYTGEWANVVDRVKTIGPAALTPRTYLAAMDAAPFLDGGLTARAERKARSVVFGILKEGGDGR